jgi:hypothetical protein
MSCCLNLVVAASAPCEGVQAGVVGRQADSSVRMCFCCLLDARQVGVSCLVASLLGWLVVAWEVACWFGFAFCLGLRACGIQTVHKLQQLWTNGFGSRFKLYILHKFLSWGVRKCETVQDHAVARVFPRCTHASNDTDCTPPPPSATPFKLHHTSTTTHTC